MANYGRYDVIRYPKFYAITDMHTHQIMTTTTNQAKAHRIAKRMMYEFRDSPEYLTHEAEFKAKVEAEKNSPTQ